MESKSVLPMLGLIISKKGGGDRKLKRKCDFRIYTVPEGLPVIRTESSKSQMFP